VTPFESPVKKRRGDFLRRSKEKHFLRHVGRETGITKSLGDKSHTIEAILLLIEQTNDVAFDFDKLL
jgi:hypothetical protein